MPGSKTTPGLAGARNDALASVAFRGVNNVGTRVYNAFAAQWLAYTLPYRRFAVILAEDCARIGGDVGCYSFTPTSFVPVEVTDNPPARPGRAPAPRDDGAADVAFDGSR